MSWPKLLWRLAQVGLLGIYMVPLVLDKWAGKYDGTVDGQIIGALIFIVVLLPNPFAEYVEKP